MIEKIKMVWYSLGFLILMIGMLAFDSSMKVSTIMIMIGCLILYTHTIFEDENE